MPLVKAVHLELKQVQKNIRLVSSQQFEAMSNKSVTPELVVEEWSHHGVTLEEQPTLVRDFLPSFDGSGSACDTTGP